MSTLVQVVDSLENRISKLLHKYKMLKQTNQKLTGELAKSQKTIKDQKKMITEWEEKYNTLKIANSMLGSNQNKTEAKLKINTLIREIDACIAQLSE
jgi:chromosome segregation ATPase